MNYMATCSSSFETTSSTRGIILRRSKALSSVASSVAPPAARSSETSYFSSEVFREQQYAKIPQILRRLFRLLLSWPETGRHSLLRHAMPDDRSHCARHLSITG